LEPWRYRGRFFDGLTVDAVLSPVVGYLLDLSGTKKIASSGCLMLAAGLFLSGSIDSLWQFYVFFGLISAVGITFTGMVPHVFLVSEWFASNRASAIGFVYAGTGVGILLLAPLSEWLLANFGWRRAFQTFAAIVLILLLPVSMFYQPGPHSEKLRSKKTFRANRNQWTAKLALRSLQFWLLFLARICAASGTTVIVTHQVAHVVDVGYTKLMLPISLVLPASRVALAG
jgi:MFS family permease